MSTLSSSPGRSPSAAVPPASDRRARTEATILHADLDAFFASVEQRDNPMLRGKPVIVGGGVVLAASYEARAMGVRTAMGGRQARALCPRAVVVPPRMDAYSDASKAVFQVFENTTPLVEGISIDEAFLDVGGLRRIAGTPAEIAERLRRQVLSEVGLRITVGVARTKFLAKVASGVAKPDGLLVVPPDRELDFLHPLPVERVWGVGAKTAAKLHDRGVFRVGEIAALNEDVLRSWLGPAAARQLHALSHNRDPRPVQTGRRRRSMGTQRAMGPSSRRRSELDIVVLTLVDRICGRLRAADRVTRTITLRLRFEDFTRVTRSHTLPRATSDTTVVLRAMRSLVAEAMPLIEQRGITLMGITLSNLDASGAVQLAFDLDRREAAALDHAVDGVRDRFGKKLLVRAALLGRPDDVVPPQLPDLDEPA